MENGLIFSVLGMIKAYPMRNDKMRLIFILAILVGNRLLRVAKDLYVFLKKWYLKSNIKRYYLLPKMRCPIHFGFLVHKKEKSIVINMSLIQFDYFSDKK